MKISYSDGAVSITADSGETTRISVPDYYYWLGRVMSGNFRPHRDSIADGQLYIQPRRTDEGKVISRLNGIYVTEQEWEDFKNSPREALQIAPLPPDTRATDSPQTGSPYHRKG